MTTMVFKWQQRLMEQQAAESPPRRHFMRNRTGARMFAAARQDRLGTAWGGTPLTADEIVDRNQVVLVARSREQSANNDYGRSFLRMCRQNIVGPKGVMLQAQSMTSRGKLDNAANQAIEDGWLEWGKRKHCDVTGRRSWRAIQNNCITSAAKDGEFMVRMVFGADAGPWGFALQVLDPQRCPIDLNDQRPRTGAFIRQGIEFNRYGRPLAYYFTTTDESEAGYHWGGKSYVRIPAEEIIHGFLEDMVGQKRGLPWMATALFRMRQLGAMEEAAIIKARTGANQMGFVEWDEGYGPETKEKDDEELTIESEPGEWRVLPSGARVKESNPQYPTGEYAPFYKQALRGMAAGFGVLYNNLASDLEGVNFSSIRQGTLDEREHWKDLQEWLVESLIEPVFEAWLPRVLLAGLIKVKGKPLPAERIDQYRVVEWQARRWQWIDPRADVNSAVEAKNNMLTSPGKIIREQGQDPQTVWQESARDVAAMIEAYKSEGIDEATAKELVLLSMGRPQPKVAPTPSADKAEA
ncbi:phage portal protein [Aeromonas veronii]|uniref:phage portal protein n=1 Tax=Aeromonas veronii TaxID=654 RepID=UPI0028530D03|nr:phage portal protein [Aeromonas veronii]MDR5013485.1 phage portal protein [Aeromonas veronii]